VKLLVQKSLDLAINGSSAPTDDAPRPTRQPAIATCAAAQSSPDITSTRRMVTSAM
jgi:hypothetical protein